MNVIANARSSQVARLLSNEGRVFALEQKSSDTFNNLVRAAQSGFPVSLCRAGKVAIDEALKRGEKLSPRTAELHSMLKKATKTPALFH